MKGRGILWVALNEGILWLGDVAGKVGEILTKIWAAIGGWRRAVAIRVHGLIDLYQGPGEISAIGTVKKRCVKKVKEIQEIPPAPVSYDNEDMMIILASYFDMPELLMVR